MHESVHLVVKLRCMTVVYRARVDEDMANLSLALNRVNG